MTPKTKVLKILDKYRDMSQTFGCEFTMNPRHDIIHKIAWETIGGEYVSANDGEEYMACEAHILGHPATPLTLLKALRIGSIDGTITWSAMGHDFIVVDKAEWKESLTIPLTTTLSEIPEEDKMWQAVLDVLI